MLPVFPNPALDGSSEPNEKQSCIEKKLAIRAYSMTLARMGFWKMQQVKTVVAARLSVGLCNER